jgi:hypothetical protein
MSRWGVVLETNQYSVSEYSLNVAGTETELAQQAQASCREAARAEGDTLALARGGAPPPRRTTMPTRVRAQQRANTGTHTTSRARSPRRCRRRCQAWAAARRASA